MERFELARRLVLEAGERLRRVRLDTEAIFQKSGPHDLVTLCDRETEQFLRRSLLTAFPHDTIVGEEFPSAGDGAGDRTWYIDPIDGTTNFINQRRNFAISVGCYKCGLPEFSLVLDVAREALYSARAGQGAFRNDEPIRTSGQTCVENMLFTTSGVLHTFLYPHPFLNSLLRLGRDARGVRSLGSVALEICEVASGEADLFVAMRSSPWDHNGARLILLEAGGAIEAVDGSPLPVEQPSTVLACSCPEALQRIRSAYFTKEE